MRSCFLVKLLLTFLLSFFQCQFALAADSSPGETTFAKYNIGIVIDGPFTGKPNIVKIFQDELVRMAEGEFEILFPEDMVLQADATREDISRKIDRLLQDPKADLILTLGTIGSTEAIKRTNLVKPVIAPFVFDAKWQNAPNKDGTSGVYNLFYVDLHAPIDQELIDFRKIVPFDKLGLLLDERDINGVPTLNRMASYLANEHSIMVHLVPVGSDAEDVFSALPDDIQAVMVGPLWQLSSDELSELSSGFVERGIAAFSMTEYDYLEKGFFATKMPDQALEQLARQVAINVQEILLGENPAALSVAFSRSDKLAINMATARAINIYPNLDYMTGAKLINEQRKDIERRLNLRQAVEEALFANLDLAVAEREVKAGSYSVEEARSTLLPRLYAGAAARAIDDDRAAAGGGTAPEQTLTGGLNAILEIYSENSWAGYTSQKFLQAGRESDRDRIKLDIIYDASTAYLNVLRQDTIERLQKDNMQLTQANLERAQIRLSTGVAGPDELYRWETQFARDRQVVLRAESSSRDAKQRLNRILNRPLLEEFVTQEGGYNDPLKIGGNRLFYQLIHNPLYFQKFNTFALDNGLIQSPELKVIDAAIAAQERLLLKSERDYWVPTVTIEGDLNYLFSDGGEGTRDEDLTGLDDTDWQIGVYATLPLYEGGRRSAAKNRNKELLVQLQTERLATEDRVGQRILQSLNNTRASFPSINLSRDAAYAARRNLQLVTDSYVEGIKSVIDLLDAQNQALIAELDSANAVYNFLIDFMGLQRSMGIFATFLPDGERQMWVERVKNYLKQ